MLRAMAKMSKRVELKTFLMESPMSIMDCVLAKAMNTSPAETIARGPALD